jgi:nicotinamidase-related amidase
MRYLVEESQLSASISFANYPLQPDKTALVIVDMQYGFLDKDSKEKAMYPGWDALISAHQKLIKFFRENKIPIIWLVFNTAPHTKSDLWLIIPEALGPPEFNFAPGKRDAKVIKEVAPLPEESVVYKHNHDGFWETDLDTVLRSFGVERVVFSGVATNFCVSSTMRSAFYRGYKPVLITDASGTVNQEMHEAECTVLGMRFGRLMNTDEVISELSAVLKQ